MILKKIKFSNYKIFEKSQEFELKPITILIGKNSAGKSSLLKLPLLIFNSFNNSNDSSLINMQLSELDLGYEYKDLLYNKYETRILDFALEFEYEKQAIEFQFGIFNIPEKNRQIISHFKFTSKTNNVELKSNLDDSYKVTYSGNINTFSIVGLDIFFTNLLPLDSGDNETSSRLKTVFNSYAPLLEPFLQKIRYLLPFRAFPKRLYENRRAYNNISDFNGKRTPQSLLNDNILQKKVSEWYSENLDIANIELKKIDREGRFFEINVYPKKSERIPVNLFDVGQGISQSLPIVTRAYMERENIIEIIEQPELHLHPGAHGEIASLLVESSKRNVNSTYIIETHSENFILRIRRLVAEGVIPKDWVNIYWIDNDEDKNSSSLKMIQLDEKGEVDYWPEGIFSEAFEEVRAIRRAQRDK